MGKDAGNSLNSNETKQTAGSSIHLSIVQELMLSLSYSCFETNIV